MPRPVPPRARRTGSRRGRCPPARCTRAPLPAEAGHLAGRVETLDGRAVGAEGAGVEVGLDAAERLAGEDVQLDADQRARRRVEDAVRGGDPAEAVADVAAGVADALDLGVLGVGVGQLEVAGLDLAPDGSGVQERLVGEPVHPVDELLQVRRRHEVGALAQEGVHRTGRALAEDAFAQEAGAVLGGDVRVLLGAGERELLLDDLLGEDEPRVVVVREAVGGAQVTQGAEGVVAGQAGLGQPAAQGVEPHRGGAGQDADAVSGPDRVPVPHALGVVPHPVAVDQACARLGADVQHPPVDVGGHAGDHLGGRGAQAFGPVAADDVVVAPDASGGDDHGPGGECELADGVAVGGDAAGRAVLGEDGAPDAARRAALHDQVVDAVTVVEGEQPVARGLLRVPHERFDDPGAGAPGDVEARHRVAVPAGPEVAALGPADGGQEGDAVPGEPGALLPRRPLDVGAGPAHRPGVLVLGPVEAGAALPVAPGQVEGVLDAETALLRGVDQEEAAEGPEGLPAEVGRVLLVDQGHPAAPAGQLVRGDQTRQSRSDHDDVGVHGDRPFLFVIDRRRRP